LENELKIDAFTHQLPVGCLPKRRSLPNELAIEEVYIGIGHNRTTRKKKKGNPKNTQKAKGFRKLGWRLALGDFYSNFI